MQRQASELSPLVFAIVGLMSEMLYADDLVLTSEKINIRTEGEVLEMEGAIRELGAEGEPWKDKSGSEWGQRVKCL